LGDEVFHRCHVVAKGDGKMPSRVRILNATFDALTSRETVEAAFRALKSGVGGWLCTVNVTTLVMMRADPSLQSFADRALIVVADGQPLVWCAPLFDRKLPERVTGIDLIDLICARAEMEGVGVYLLGATESLLMSAIVNLRRRFPRLKIDGSDGYFPAQCAKERARRVRASGAKLLIVGMGTPRQEEFISEQWEELGVGLAIGVGGSFDVLSGARFRAPRWIRQIGLEWLVRAVQEPRRLLPRYLSANSKFCFLIANAIMHRLARRSVSSR
jgi:N-acetylglucosaminyldiphosphoundecaprenol N-acetyl-beta-D-mannosaminyltransferase